MVFLSFLGFLLAYVLLIAASVIFMQRQQSAARSGSGSAANEIIGPVLIQALLCVVMWAATGFFDLKIILLFLGATLAGISISLVLGAVFAVPIRQARPRIFAAAYEVGRKSPWWVLLFVAFSTVAVFVYPFYVGYLLLWRGGTGDALVLAVTKATFLVFGVSGILGTVPMIIRLLASPNLDEGTRSRVFVGQIGSMLPNGIMAAVAFYAFGSNLDIAAWNAEIQPVGVTLPIPIVGIAFGAFLLTGLLPYVLGVKRAETFCAELTRKETALIDQLHDIYLHPNPQSYAPALAGFGKGLEEQIRSFVASQSILAQVMAASEKPEDERNDNDRLLLSTYGQAAEVDRRFEHLSLLHKLHTDTATAADDLNASTTDADRLAKAARYAQLSSRRKQQIQEAAGTRSHSTKPQLFALISLALGALGSSAIGQLAKYLWEVIVRNVVAS